MKFSELLNFKINDPENVKRLSNMGVLSFGKGITKKNQTITPHYEINESLKGFETVPIINSAVNQLVNFIIPNKDIIISSKDSKSVEFLEKWHKERPDFLEEMKNILTTNIVCGNGVAERFFAETVDGKKVLDNLFSMNDVSRIYVNPDDIDGPTAYIFELPVGIKEFKYMGEIFQPQFYQVKYIKNYTFTFQRVYGIPIPSWKFQHYKSGWSRDNLYGRSQLTSAIDAVNIFKEIMSSWDTIAKTRQIDQKLLSLGDSESGQTYDADQITEIENKLNESDNSYNILGLPLKFVQTDISVSQGFNLMEGPIDMLRRQIMTSLLPQHLTPWSDSATTQGSESAMPPFMLRLKSKQNEFIKFMNTIVLEELRKTYDWLADDISYVLDQPKVMADDYYSRFVSDLVREQIISVKEAKDYLLKMGILDADVFESIEDEVQEEPKPEPEQIETVVKEAVKKANVTFEVFKSRLSQRHKKKPFNTSGWEEIDFKEIGGHNVRLVDTKVGVYLLFDGLNMIETYDQEVIDENQVKQSFNNYIEKLKKSFDEFTDEKTPEDEMFDQLQKEIEEEYTKRLNLFFKQIDKSAKKKEDFLSPKILPKLDDVFKGFNLFINKKVNSIMKKFNVNVIKSDDDGVVDKKTVDNLKDKNDLMVKNLQTNLKQVKDDQVQSIRTKLASGIAGGQSVADIKADLEKDTDYDQKAKNKIDLAIQTAGRNATRIIKLKKYQDMGFDEVVWVTRDDSKVRPEHNKMNNKVFSIKQVLEWYIKGTLPGSIYRCRCSQLPY